ncbi:MAG: peptidyl-prolyl cis-trans isomerase [Desulfatiglandales bacterium]
MNRIRSLGILIVSAALIVLCLHQVSAEIFNRVVAIVNDEVITLYELNQKIKEITGREADDLRTQDESKFLKTRRSVLALLIDEKIAREKIRELGIRVTSGQVDAAIEGLKQDYQWTHEDLMARLNKQGTTYEKYRDTIKEELERVRLIHFEVKSKIVIREEESREYYDSHLEQFSSEGQVHLAGIFLMRTDPDDKEEFRELSLKGGDILARLKEGEDFGELAKEFSQGPGADDGGDLGLFKTDQLDPELKEILDGVPEGEVSNLIITPNGIQIIKLIKNQKKEVKPFDEVKDAIFGILYREEVNRRYMTWIGELRKTSYTKIIF